MFVHVFVRRHRWLVAALALLWPGIAAAQEGPVADLGLEELLGAKIERVFGASRRLQPVTEAPSSVTIVTADEIERFGYESLADILRGVRGLYVSYDRNYSYTGTRGFSLPGDYNTKVLLLVDGHRMNDNIYDQAAIGLEFGLDVSTFDRVEIIRGPSSSLYGTNAFFAVVNVVTKTGASQRGLAAKADVGNFGRRRAAISFGQRTRRGLDLFVSGSMIDSDGTSHLYVPAFDSPDTNDGIAAGIDGERAAQTFAHLRFKAFTLKTAYGNRTKTIPTAAYGTAFNDPTFRTVDSRGFVDLQWDKDIRGTSLDVRGYVDHYHYEGSYPYDDGDEELPYYHYDDYAIGTWMGVDARASRRLPWRQTLTVGGELRRNIDQNQGAVVADTGAVDFEISQSSGTYGAYVIDEIALHERVLLNVGGRYDDYRNFRRVTPRAAVIVTPVRGGTFKYLFGTAFRAPNAYEKDYWSYSSGGHAGDQGYLRAESITTHELVWEKYTSNWLRSSVSVYANQLNDLIQLQSDEDGGFSFANVGRAAGRGLELEAEFKTRSGLQALSSYTLQDAYDRDTDASLMNSPRHMIKSRVTVPTWKRGATASAEIQYMSRRQTLGGFYTDAATVFNVSLIQPLRPGIALTSRVGNLFNSRYADPASAEHRQDVIEQDGRKVMVGVRWDIGGRK